MSYVVSAFWQLSYMVSAFRRTSGVRRKPDTWVRRKPDATSPRVRLKPDTTYGERSRRSRADAVVPVAALSRRRVRGCRADRAASAEARARAARAVRGGQAVEE